MSGCRGTETICRVHFSPPTMWVLGMELLGHQDCHQASLSLSPESVFILSTRKLFLLLTILFVSSRALLSYDFLSLKKKKTHTSWLATIRSMCQFLPFSSFYPRHIVDTYPLNIVTSCSQMTVVGKCPAVG